VVVLGDLADGLDVLVGHADEALHQRLETGLGLAVAGGRQGGQGAAVKGFFHDDDDRRIDALLMAEEAGQLDGGLVGFATGVAEKDLFHAGKPGQTIGKLLLQGNPV